MWLTCGCLLTDSQHSRAVIVVVFADHVSDGGQRPQWFPRPIQAPTSSQFVGSVLLRCYHHLNVSLFKSVTVSFVHALISWRLVVQNFLLVRFSLSFSSLWLF